MRTEALVKSERPTDPHEVSPALQERIPAVWRLTDSWGKPVPLSLAGHVLHFGRSYQLRFGAPSEGEPLPTVRLATWPAFVEPLEQPQTISKHGHEYRCLPFRVRRQSSWLTIFKWPYEVLNGDLKVECICGEPTDPHPPLLTCPVVARTPWGLGLILLLVMGALLGWLIGQIQIIGRDLLIKENWPGPDLAAWWLGLQAGPRFWLWPVVLAVLNPLCCLVSNILHLSYRRHQLEARYRERYGSLRLAVAYLCLSLAWTAARGGEPDVATNPAMKYWQGFDGRSNAGARIGVLTPGDLDTIASGSRFGRQQ